MGFVWVSQFECAACGAREATTRLEYDDLGYAVCPGCGRNHGPEGRRPAGREPTRGVVAEPSVAGR